MTIKDLTKKEQLKVAFKTIVKKALEETQDMLMSDEYIITHTTDDLLREVSIRTKIA